MRDFAAIERELGLEEFLDSRGGTLFFVPLAVGRPRLIVRRFDREWAPALIGPYVDLVGAAQAWIERDEQLERLVRVEQPRESGEDFVARPHHLYHVALDSYDEDELAPPPELRELRARFAELARDPADEADEIIIAVLAGSILAPTGKTYWSGEESRFVIVEPALSTELLERWAQRTG